MTGRHENDYYTICSRRATDGTTGYYIFWLDNGGKTCGFVSADEARKNADRIADRMSSRDNLSV